MNQDIFSKARRPAIVGAIVFAATVPGRAADVAWYSIDTGGVTVMTGGGLNVAATLGQPDAISMSGGGEIAAGGFWTAAPGVLPPLGDCDGDGAISLLDAATFVACLTGPSNPGNPQCICADLDNDQDVDLADFARLHLTAPGE